VKTRGTGDHFRHWVDTENICKTGLKEGSEYLGMKNRFRIH
jgi:hypothetical protein